MAPVSLVYFFFVWCPVSALIYGDRRDSVNAGSSKSAVGELAGQAPPCTCEHGSCSDATHVCASCNAGYHLDGDSCKATVYYLVQRVGFQDSGPAKQPRSPHVAGAECLTAGGPDRLRGTALGWSECQDLTTVESEADIDQSKREKQLFLLNSNGTLSDKHGRCLRRKDCEEGHMLQGYAYDLYPCGEVDGKFAVKVKVLKAQANSVDHLRDMGYLANAVQTDNCQLCGPYRLQNQCLLSSCGDSYQGKPGWTKLASQYIGDTAVFGNSPWGDSGDSTDLGATHAKEQMMGIDMSGIGYTHQSAGICGSWVTDSPTVKSYFYVLQA